MTGLLVAWCPRKAAELAVRRWHYSHSMPACKVLTAGVWEDGRFVGAVVVSRGSNPNMGSPYGLDQTEICELTRVALDRHATPVSRILAIVARMVKAQSPGLRLMVSYAAAEEGHHGGIYQAAGWLYEGAKPSHVIELDGKRVHARTISCRYGRGSQSRDYLARRFKGRAQMVKGLVRHKYLLALDGAMRRQLAPLAQPYPKRVKHAMAGDPSAQRRCDTDPPAPPSSAE